MPRMTMEKVRIKFFECLNEEWGLFIEKACATEAAFQHDPMLGKDDLKQDIFEYVYRYCFKQVYKRSKKGEIWIPHLRTSIRNCFVNLRKSTKNWRIRLDMVSTDVTDMNYVASEGKDRDNGAFAYQSESFFDKSASVLEEIEYSDYCREVAAMLTRQEKFIFYSLLNPSEEFSKFIKSETFGRANTRITRKMVSDFFGINPATVFDTFKKFRTSIELCNATV